MRVRILCLYAVLIKSILIMKKFYRHYLLIVSVFVSCSYEQNIPFINLSSPEKIETTLAEIADSIVYYPLALENGSRMPQHVELLTNAIWVSYYLNDLSEQKGDYFERKSGKLLNQMSLGPILHKKKYAFNGYNTNTCFIFNNENCLTTPPAANTKAKSYTLDVSTGEEVEAIPFSIRDIKSVSPQRICDSIFLVVTDLIGLGGKDSVYPHYSIRWYDKQMQLMKEDLFADSIYRINRQKIISLLNDRIYLHADCTPTIYELSQNEKPRPVYRYFLGEHTPSVATNSELFISKRQFDKYYNSSYYNLHSSMISDNYVFGAFDYKEKINYVLYSRKTEETWIIPTEGKSDGKVYSYKEGIKNNLDGGMDFWPRNVSKRGEIYTWYSVDDLKTKVAQSYPEQMKNPKATQRLKEMLENLPEDTNLIIAVLKEKK